jgi:predicted metalloendopeptidase
MTRVLTTLSACVLALATGCAAHKPASSTMSSSTKPAPAPEGRGASAVTPTPAPSVTRAELADTVKAALDPKTDPCTDFYRYACGGWLDSQTIPADQSAWSRGFSVIAERNRIVLREILEDAAKNPGASPDNAKLGAFWSSCMDEAAAETAGAAPLKPRLESIARVNDTVSVMRESGRMYREGSDTLFTLFVDADQKDPDYNILQIYQGGTGLPDRDYYLENDPDKTRVREAYRTYISGILQLAGDAPDAARRSADAIIAFETELAKVSWPVEELRDTERTYNKLNLAGLQKLTPALSWDAFWAGAGHSEIKAINVATPSFFEGLGPAVSKAPLSTLRDYLRFHYVSDMAPYLSKAFVDKRFEFRQALTGQAEIEPRWKRCTNAANDSLGDMLGKSFVERTFPGDSKKIALQTITDIEAGFAANLPSLTWMDDETRARALDKMKAIRNKVGYPDKWIDYSAYQVRPGDWFGNSVRSNEFQFDREAKKVNYPVDRDEWGLTPPEVNAYYNPGGNEMAFPAGILQAPFFSRDFPPAMNYGGIGLAMGHELTHGFDDEGRKYDKNGKLTDWWSPEVSAKFDEQAACIEKQYSAYEVQPGIFVNGKLTLGENIADNGGIKQAFRAWRDHVARAGDEPQLIAGMGNDKLFFIAYAQSWCQLTRPEYEQLLTQVDPHSQPRARINGPLANFPEFSKSFGCAEGTKMHPANPCTVW